MSRRRDREMARYLAGEMNMKEEIAFMQLWGSHIKQQTVLKKMEKNWKYFDQNPAGESRDTVQAWNQLHERLASDGLLEEDSGAGPLLRTPFLRLAASIALILAIAIPSVYFGLIRDKGENPGFNYTAQAGVSTVDLPDGSRVYLNKGAELSYSGDFSKQRSVQLTGEAFFEVMSDPLKPFSVHSGEIVVSVLGTSFNVKETVDSGEVEVYVKTGKVRMALEESDQFVTLEPEDFGTSTNRGLSSSVQNDPNYISWKTKDFKFVNRELVDVLKDLAASYHVEIHYGEIDLEDLRVTTSYSEQSIDAILETIATAFDLSVNHKDKSYFLTK